MVFAGKPLQKVVFGWGKNKENYPLYYVTMYSFTTNYYTPRRIPPQAWCFYIIGGPDSELQPFAG